MTDLPVPQTQTRTCTASVLSDWDQRRCGKPAKGMLANGKPACGVHLRQERQHRQALTDALARREADEAKEARLDALGIGGFLHRDANYRTTGMVVVNLDALERLHAKATP